MLDPAGGVLYLPVRFVPLKTRRAFGRTGPEIRFVAGSGDGAVFIPAPVGDSVPVDVRGKSSCLFQAGCELSVLSFMLQIKTAAAFRYKDDRKAADFLLESCG